MCDITGAITAVCGANPAGIKRIWIAAAARVATIATAVVATHTVSTAITMTIPATDRFWSIGHIFELGENNEGLTGDVGFQAVSRMLKFSIPSLIEGNVAKLQGMIGGEFIAIIQYVDNKYRIIGDKTSPLRLLKADFTSGKYGSTDKRGFTVELASSGGAYSYFYTGTLTGVVDVP